MKGSSSQGNKREAGDGDRQHAQSIVVSQGHRGEAREADVGAVVVPEEKCHDRDSGKRCKRAVGATGRVTPDAEKCERA